MFDQKMKRSRERRRHGIDGRPGIIGMLVTALTAGLLSACMSGYDVPADFPCPQENLKGTYTLDLKIAAGNLSARSSAHGTVDGDAAENFINVSSDDYAVFIFDGDGNFVQRFEPGAVSLEMDGKQDYVYHINGAFRPEDELKAVQIMVLANWRTEFGGDYLDVEHKMSERLTASDRSNSLNYLYGNASDFNFTLPVTTTTVNDGSSSSMIKEAWVPKNETSGIPMFGLSEKIDMKDKTMLGNSIVLNTENPIPMLRSLAKIEIVDMVPDGKSADITKCVLTGYNEKGRFIPHVEDNDGTDKDVNVGWNLDNIQVTTPSLPQEIETGTNLHFYKTQKTVRTEGAITDEIKPCFVVYVPEMDLTDDRPVIEVYLKDATIPSAIIQLADYNGGKEPEREDKTDPYYKNLLRNHSYRYNILAVGIEADIQLFISNEKEWDIDEDAYLYEDIKIEFGNEENEKKFEWNWKEKNKNKEEGENLAGEVDRRDVVVSIDSDFGGEATFTITEPARGSWTLSLYSDDDTPNHWFRIDTWDAKRGEWVTGSDSISAPITGDETTIRVVATELQYTGDIYTARLVMNVTTFDGRMMEVNLARPKKPMDTINPATDYYRIMQYPTATQ